MESFETLLDYSAGIHGHLCAGQVIGVRMAMLGLRLLHIDDPRGQDRKKLYVIVEIDRCATDAIQAVTGCSLGKRSLKWLDHGVMAATFVHLIDDKAIRIVAREEARQLAARYCPGIDDKYRQQLEAYRVMPEAELFTVRNVHLTVPPSDLPGRPTRRVQCDGCGEFVQDSRDVEIEGRTLCKGCAFGRYYVSIE